jgi:hypothetical protein
MNNTKKYKLIKRKDKTIKYKTRQISLSLSLSLYLIRKMATDWPKQLAGLIKQFNWTWTRSPVATIQHTVNTSLKQPTT